MGRDDEKEEEWDKEGGRGKGEDENIFLRFLKGGRKRDMAAAPEYAKNSPSPESWRPFITL